MTEGLDTFVDWFAGIGGFRLGAEANGLTCKGACDFDKFARQTYGARFGHEPEFRDAKQVDPREVPDHDLFCAGFPCQPFSLAGKRGGFQDDRGTLFFDITRILEAKRPNYFLLENVKGLLSAPINDENGKPVHGTSGWVFLRIMETLGNLGYCVQWQVLNVRYWLPQNRERVYLVGNSTAVPFPEVFPLFDDAKEVGEDKGRLDFRSIGKLHKHQGGRVYDGNSIAPTLDTGRGPLIDLGDEMGLRLMTPVERERLQGFPDGWTDAVSDTQRYKQTGNAVCVKPVQEIIRVLKECHQNGGKRINTEED